MKASTTADKHLYTSFVTTCSRIEFYFPTREIELHMLPTSRSAEVISFKPTCYPPLITEYPFSCGQHLLSSSATEHVPILTTNLPSPILSSATETVSSSYNTVLDLPSILASTAFVLCDRR